MKTKSFCVLSQYWKIEEAGLIKKVYLKFKRLFQWQK